MTIEYPPPDARLVDRARIVRSLPARDVLHVASGGHRDECDIAAAAAPEIERLAALPALDYERERKQVASRLGIRVRELDRLARARRHTDAAVTHGRAVMFAELEPWPGPVDGRELLDALSLNVHRRVVMADHAADTAALWVLHTHLLDCFDVSPRLAITSPEKGCGKTTLLDVLAHLVSRPLFAANVTPAAVFRVIETHRPTLLIDEADTFLPENDELRGVLNSGHRRGGSVIRTVGDEHEPRAFATYAACAIALIDALPGTLADRSVTIALRRRRPDEAIEAFRSDRTGPLDALARQAARWAADHADRVQETDPAMPAGVYNRVADNWRPLLAIADVAGGHWPQRARRAAMCDRGGRRRRVRPRHAARGYPGDFRRAGHGSADFGRVGRGADRYGGPALGGMAGRPANHRQRPCQTLGAVRHWPGDDPRGQCDPTRLSAHPIRRRMATLFAGCRI